MKILVIISSHEMLTNYLSNIQILNDYLIDYSKNDIVDYCGISNKDDFSNYESIISFKYKSINTKYQFGKICDFITENKDELDYDWYIKFRPEIKLLEPINFASLNEMAINSRARKYIGPKKIKFGMSINGKGGWGHLGDCHYDDIEKLVIPDDSIFIFHNNLVKKGAFDSFNDDEFYNMKNNLKNEIVKNECIGYERWIYGGENEWFGLIFYSHRNIHLNVIGINMIFEKCNAYSGDLEPV